VGSPILLNGIRFEIIGVLSKVGQDGNNGTNARILFLLRRCVICSGSRIRTAKMQSRSQLPPADAQRKSPAKEEVHDYSPPSRIRSEAY